MGGGLCSPGLWPPHRRHDSGLALLRLREALCAEIQAIDPPGGPGASALLRRIIGGGVTSDPFPAEATARLRALLADMVGRRRDKLAEGLPVVDQPIDVLTLGALLQEIGDPDYEIMKVYATGVPLGVNIDLPRTPAVFPEKVKWNVDKQEKWLRNKKAHQGNRKKQE